MPVVDFPEDLEDCNFPSPSPSNYSFYIYIYTGAACPDFAVHKAHIRKVIAQMLSQMRQLSPPDTTLKCSRRTL